MHVHNNQTNTFAHMRTHLYNQARTCAHDDSPPSAVHLCRRAHVARLAAVRCLVVSSNFHFEHVKRRRISWLEESEQATGKEAGFERGLSGI